MNSDNYGIFGDTDDFSMIRNSPYTAGAWVWQ